MTSSPGAPGRCGEGRPRRRARCAVPARRLGLEGALRRDPGGELAARGVDVPAPGEPDRRAEAVALELVPERLDRLRA